MFLQGAVPPHFPLNGHTRPGGHQRSQKSNCLSVKPTCPMKTPNAHPSRRFQPAQATSRDGRRRRALAATLKAVPLAVALLLGSQAARAQTYYRAQILPDLPWPDVTAGRSLNDSGVIVGFNDQQGIHATAFRWSFAEGLQILGKPAQAIDITNNGTAVGFLPSQDTPGATIPIRWSATTSYAPLSSVYAGAPVDGIPWVVNDQDWILVQPTGSRDLLLLRPGQPALLVRQEIISNFRFPPLINENGMVAGSVAAPGSSSSECFIWTQTGGVRTFTVVNGGSNLLGGLNDNGLIVGQAYVIGEWPPTGFLYDANTSAVLRTQPGFSPRGINNSGAIVGDMYHETPVLGGSSAAEWRDGAIVNLNDVTTGLGFYYLTQAIDINASGQILALALVNPDLIPPTWRGPYGVTVLLSECARCGQIKPNPNPASTLLDVGPDWFNAFNAEDYRNEGTLQICT